MSFQDVEKTIDKLESNLIAEINELRATTEIVLKELTLYLNVSANDIGQMKEENQDAYKTIEKIINTLDILETINGKINSIPSEFKKINQFLLDLKKESGEDSKRYFNSNSANLKTIYKYMQAANKETKENLAKYSSKIDNLGSEMSLVVDALKDYKNEINRGQENLINVINTLITSSGEKIKVEGDLKKTEITAGTKKLESKNNLWIKIVGSLVGAGGVVTLIVQVILNSIKG